MFTNLYHSRVGFAPGMLSVCDQPVQYIEWETAYRESAETVWKLVTDLQKSGAPKQLSHDNFCRLFKEAEKLSLSHLAVSTDANTLDIHPYGKQHISVRFPDGAGFQCRAAAPFEAGASQTAQVLYIALYLAGCTTPEQAAKKLAKMKLLGIATDWRD